MAAQDDYAFSDAFRSTPVEFATVSCLPVLLALAQLANSYVNDLSFLVSVPFAVVMVLFAVLLTQHQLAQFRRRRFERGR